MSPTNTFANCIIDEDNFICMKRVLALDISIVKHYVGYIRLFFFTDYNLLGQLLVVCSRLLHTHRPATRTVPWSIGNLFNESCSMDLGTGILI